jgi:hypothetical protein
VLIGTGNTRRLDLLLPPAGAPQITSSLQSLGHGGAVDLGPRRWEDFEPCNEGFVLVFRVKVCRDVAQVVAMAPRAIRSTRLQLHLGGNIERLVGVVWSSRISSVYVDLRIVKELHRQFFLLLRLWNGCGLLDPFGDFPYTTNNVRPTQGGLTVAARRRHGLEVEDEKLLKDLVVIFIFLGVLYIVCCFF